MQACGPPENESPGTLAGNSEADVSKTTDDKTNTMPHSVRCFLALLAASTDQRLSRADIACLGVILDRFNRSTGNAWPGINSLAVDAKLHRSNVIRAIQRLETTGYLKVQRAGQGRSNRYIPTFATSSADATGSENATSSADATGSENATSSADATKVVAQTRLQLVAPARPEPAYRTYPKNLPKKNSRETSLAERFQEFWNAFPRKQGDKGKAARTWAKKGLDSIADQIIAHVVKRVASDPQWRDRNFIPLPTTFLNGDRWNDEWTPEIRKPSAADCFTGRVYEGTSDADLPTWAQDNA